MYFWVMFLKNGYFSLLEKWLIRIEVFRFTSRGGGEDGLLLQRLKEECIIRYFIIED